MPEGNNWARSIADGGDQPYLKVLHFSAHLWQVFADLDSKFVERCLRGRGSSMADHLTISTESDLASPAMPTTAITRRSLLGGAGIAVGAAVLASPPSMPGIATAAAQPASTDPRPLDAAFRRRAFEVREACASNNEKIPIAPHPTNGDEARYSNKIGSDSRGLPHDKRGEVEQAAWQAL